MIFKKKIYKKKLEITIKYIYKIKKIHHYEIEILNLMA